MSLILKDLIQEKESALHISPPKNENPNPPGITQSLSESSPLPCASGPELSLSLPKSQTPD